MLLNVCIISIFFYIYTYLYGAYFITFRYVYIQS